MMWRRAGLSFGLISSFLLLAVLLVAAPRAGAEPTQFRLIDATLTHKATAAARVNYAAPPDWTSPIDYANGRMYLRLDVTSKKTSLPVMVQLCFWRNNFAEETCTGYQGVSTVGTYWVDLGVPAKWWKLNSTWSWTQPFDYSALMVKDALTGSLLMTGNACGVSCYTGTENLANHTPIVFKAQSIVVAKGATLNAPGWAGCPAGWSTTCAGAVGNTAPVADAGPDRTLAPGGFRTALKATTEDDGLPSSTITSQWSKLSGPGTVTFSAPTAAATNATFSAAGTYELAYRGSDGQYGDSDTVTVVVPDGGTPPPPPPTRTAHLLVGNAATPSAPDRAIRTRLAGKGFTVTLVDDNALTPTSLTGSNLVVISASVDALLVPAWLADLAVPVLSSESAAQATLRLGSGSSLLSAQTTLTIADATSPLAAGLSGNVVTSAATVYGSVNSVAPGATVVARLSGRPRVAIFGIDTGAALTTGTAPARRVGFFLAPFTAPALNTDGWKLFDAAVDWSAPAPAGPTPRPPAANWWDAAWSYRMPVTLTSPATVADNAIGEFGLDFTSALTQAGAVAAFDPNSIRVVEVDGTGVVTNAAVPFQFDQAPGFDAATYGVGTVTVALSGPITAATPRTLHVYFDTVTAAIPAATVTTQVSVTNTTDAGMAAMQITTPRGAWFLQPDNGGLSSLVDVNSQDWLNYNATAGPGGTYRGMPNSVFPEGHGHPGFTGMTSTLLTSGPLKVSIRSVSKDGWRARWDFFPTHTLMTWEQTPTTYWFLYEGTPGGQIDLTTDRVIFSDGVNIPLNGYRKGDLPGPEWAGFADTVRNRSLFVYNLVDDTSPDEYALMGGQMTVLGFGRTSGLTPGTPAEVVLPSLSGPKTFVTGLTDGSTFSAIETAVIAASTRPVAAVTALETRV